MEFTPLCLLAYLRRYRGKPPKSAIVSEGSSSLYTGLARTLEALSSEVSEVSEKTCNLRSLHCIGTRKCSKELLKLDFAGHEKFQRTQFEVTKRSTMWSVDLR